jgi:hypothetical protein
MRETEVFTTDRRVLHAYDVGPTARSDELVVLWHHGTPNVGAPPEPLFEAARSLGIRWIGYDRPSYGGSTPHPGATVAAAAADARQIADQLDIGRFVVFWPLWWRTTRPGLRRPASGPRACSCQRLLPRALAGPRTRLLCRNVRRQYPRIASCCSGASRA